MKKIKERLKVKASELKDKFFLNNYNKAIKFKNEEGLNKFIQYVTQDDGKIFNELFNQSYTLERINDFIEKQWINKFKNNLKQMRYRFLSIRYSGYSYNGQNTEYLDSEDIIYDFGLINDLDNILDLLDKLKKKNDIKEKKALIPETHQEILDLLNELEV